MKYIGIGIAVAGIFLAIAWMEASEENTKAVIAESCIKSGGNFSYTWNWRPFCERKKD